MLSDMSDLRETLFAARLLREQILAAPLRPDAARRVRTAVLRANMSDEGQGVAEALVISRESVTGSAVGAAVGRVNEALLVRLAAACGGARRRTGPGLPFEGRAAPPAARLDALVAELIDTLNAPIAVETWPPIAHAFAAHFLVRLVQPFEGSAPALGFALEAALLAADGLCADRVLLPEPGIGSAAPASRPDPDAFVRARTHRLVERLAETDDLLRAETARAVLLGWSDDRASHLNARQRRLVRWLAEGGPERSIEFREYVRLHGGRRAPSLRSLQRDWKGLRESGLLGESGSPSGDRLRVDPAALAYGVTP